MNRTRLRDALLLGLTAASVLCGGGFGCAPDLRGVELRAATLPGFGWYMAFNGKKPAGSGTFALPYAVKAPFTISARMGVFDDGALVASDDEVGCIGFADRASSDDERVCFEYQRQATGGPGIGVYSNLGSLNHLCPGGSVVELILENDGTTVTARYRCSSLDAFSVLETAATKWSASEEWDAFVLAGTMDPGAQVAFDDLRITSNGPYSSDPEAAIAFETFQAFQLGLESFYDVEADDLAAAQTDAGLSHDHIALAADDVDPTFAASSGAGKLLDKAEQSHLRLLQLLPGSAAKFPKTYLKVAPLDADALAALATGF